MHSPDADDIRHQLFRSIKQDGTATSEERQQAGCKPRLTPETHALADALKDVDTPGRFRKVGPSLRHLDSKVDFDWVYAWIRNPADFRPTTRMPQFFGHYQHLESKLPRVHDHDAQGNEDQITDLEYTKRFEEIEVRALSEFLLAISQPFEYLDPPQGVNEARRRSAASGCSNRAAAWRAIRTSISRTFTRRKGRICRAWRRSSIRARDSAGSIAGSRRRTITTRGR